MRTLSRVALAGLVLTATGCQFFASKDRDVVQKGYRGTAMEVNYVARNQEQAMAELAKKMPAILPPAGCPRRGRSRGRTSRSSTTSRSRSSIAR